MDNIGFFILLNTIIIDKTIASHVNRTAILNSPSIISLFPIDKPIIKDKYIYGVGTDDSIYNFKGNVFKMSNSDFGYAEKILSNSIMEFCNSNNLHCINGFDKFDINRHNTYDFVHPNVQGSLEIAKKLYPELKTLY